MPYLHLVAAITASVLQTVFASYYNRKNTAYRDVTPIYNVLNFTTLVLLWGAMFLTDPAFLAAPSFHVPTLTYSLIFSVGFAMACVGLINALNTGPVGLTSLILQFSCVGATIWGFIFWNAPVTVPVIIGLVLVCASLFLCLYGGKQKGGNKINLKWIIYVSVCFAGNLICMVSQKQHQMDFDKQYGNQLMLVAMVFALLMSIVLYLRSDRRDTVVLLKRAWFWPVLAGVSNLLLNFFMMKLATAPVDVLSPSLIYPSIAVLPLMITIIFSRIAFREKLRWWQWIGIGIGVVATALLSV